MKCIDPDAICAHSFEGKCTAKRYEHLCPKMKEKVKKGKISKVIGN